MVYGRETVHPDSALLQTQLVGAQGPPISVDYELRRRASYPHLIAKMRARIAALA